ncbi:hypothetical protein LCGC14_2635860 [marine sediment metagenome]|uniref:Uncharacterized protein n=1 Tax=marine sediment metagenome TaxID=412755 RepID=A0A0F9ALG1_9ZZZZ
MIYLGFDLYHQLSIVNYNGQMLFCRRCPRTKEIMGGLYAVSVEAKGVKPYTHKVEYSHQAWSDLLSVAQNYDITCQQTDAYYRTKEQS